MLSAIEFNLFNCNYACGVPVSPRGIFFTAVSHKPDYGK